MAKIYYWKSSRERTCPSRDLIMGSEWLKENCPGLLSQLQQGKLETTHAYLTSIPDAKLESIYYNMQGEIWSPNGEARPLIEEKGLGHTSMSIGDIVELDDGSLHMVDSVGFFQLR